MLINLYATLRMIDSFDFPGASVAGRDRSDPELGPNLDGFAGYVARGGPMDAARFHLIQFVLRVQHNLSVEVEEADIPRMAPWMVRNNAVSFWPDGSVRDPHGRVLYAPGREADAEAALPYPADALARKAATEAALTERELHVLPSLPASVGEGEAWLRNPGDVAVRALALMGVALRGETASQGKAMPAKEICARLSISPDDFTFAERLLMEDGGLFRKAPRLSPQDAVNAAWRYEAAAILLWALGVYEAEVFPSGIVDVPGLVRCVLDAGPDAIRGSATLRPTAELLDQLDLIYRLHWLTTEARAREKVLPARVEPGVVMERHHALNWLTRFEDAYWDDVTTPT